MFLKSVKYISVFSLFFLVFCGVIFSNAQIPKKELKKLLVIHSYHQGLQWTDSISKGIQEIIKPQEEEIDVFYEYLDSKRYVDSAFTDQREVFTHKYKTQPDFDAIICVDDNALDFLLQNRQTLFRGIPIVFCGVNQPLSSKILRDSLITGIREIPPIRETLDLMLRLHPKADTFYIINDAYSLTARINRKIIKEIGHNFPKKLVLLDTFSLEELREAIAKVPQKDAILLLTFNQDKDQQFVSFKAEKRLVRENAKAPVYTVWDFFLGENIVGGKLIQGSVQGGLAATMALEILNGTPASKLPILSDSKPSYVFNNIQLKRIRITEEELPGQSLIINKPESFYKLNRIELFWLLIVFLLLLLLVFFLTRLIKKKKEAEVALLEKQKYLKMTLSQHHLISKIVTYLNSTNDLVFIIDEVLNAITATSHADKSFIVSLDSKDSISEGIGLRYASGGERVAEKDKEEWSFTLHKLFRIAVSKEKIIRNDLHYFSEKEKLFFLGENIRSIILLPVEVQNKVNAIAGFAFSTSHQWSASEISLFSTLTQVIANAWERNYQMNQYLNVEKQHSDAVSLMERFSRLTSIGVLTAGITHEINQPLNAIKINTNMLLRNQVEKTPLVQKLKAINKGINRIDQIILQMKNYWVRPVEDKETPMWVDLNKTLKDSCILIERHLAKEQISLHIQPTKSQILIQGNKIQVEQIIINLLMNAIQALKKTNKEDKRIWVKTFKQWSSSQLIVEDNGIGINEAIGEQLFDPFFSTKEEGSGLGLAIVKTFVTRMRGHIRYENRREGGVRFILDFKSLEDEKMTISPNF